MSKAYPRGFAARLDLRGEATPKPLQALPVHRWFVFPHSFGAGLVAAILDRFGFDGGAELLDPFCGAGTTLRVARERGMNAVGLDLSPLAVHVSRVKVRRYEDALLGRLVDRVAASNAARPRLAPRLLRRALGTHGLEEAQRILAHIGGLSDRGARDFFLLALLRAVRDVSAGKTDGGWLRWTRRRVGPGRLARCFVLNSRAMIADVLEAPAGKGRQSVRLADSCRPNLNGDRYHGVITSPPYPNRHDYSRVFAVELLLAFLDERRLFRLRYDSLRSHVEARGREDPARYNPPASLVRVLRDLKEAPVTDRRVRTMVDGYFKDLWLHLVNLKPFLRRGARLAYVVGNVRHAGVVVPTDVILMGIAERIGYKTERAWVIRERGNSAQQMGKFGRIPLRESVVFFSY